MMSAKPHSQDLTLDRSHLHNVRKAFLTLNDARLALAREVMTQRQRVVLDTLPALLHFNHPMLPGYVSHQAPAGVWGYKPDDETLEELRRFSRSFKANRQHHLKPDILAIYSMGSLGTIAQNNKSDVDIWLCYRPELTASELTLLEKKTTAISKWAETQGLEVTIFLMDFRLFSDNKDLLFNKESSGSTQYYLLLDEFYRSAVYLAGQLPAWLFISPEQETAYQTLTAKINHQRLLPENEHIDFGPVGQIPSSEFISSAIWQLYKAIDSPYKSILKLLLLEIYCRSYPELPLLSTLFKAQLHGVDRQRLVNIWDSDPYLQNYHYIDQYLTATGQSSRLEFVRKCFYFKLDQPLSKAKQYGKRISTLLELVREWGWSNDKIAKLDSPQNWTLDEILEERKSIINELNHSYHFVMEFFRSQEGELKASNRELNILGRKLHAAFSRKAGKIDWFNPVKKYQIQESSLRLTKSENTQWLAKNRNGKIIAQRANLLELLTWLHCNQILTANTSLYYQQEKQHSSVLNQWRRHLQQLLPLPMKPADHIEFESNCHLTKLVFFIDYDHQRKLGEKSPPPTLHSHLKIDCLTINNWREVYCQSTQGLLQTKLLEFFIQALHQDRHNFQAKVSIHHHDPVFQRDIEEALLPLFSSIQEFFNAHNNGRFITQVDNKMTVIQLNDQHVNLKHLDSDDALYRLLQEPQAHYSHIGLDHNLSRHPIGVYSQHMRPDSIQIFFRLRGQMADITIIDETGCWQECSTPYLDGNASLKPLHRFIRAVNDRRHGLNSTEIGPLDILPINFYEVRHSVTGWQAHSTLIQSPTNNATMLPLFAVVEHHNNSYQFIVHSEDTIFSEVESGKKMWVDLCHYLQEQNQQGRPHWYISDMDLSLCRQTLAENGELHTNHYLQLKDRLEKKIRHSLNQLR